MTRNQTSNDRERMIGQLRDRICRINEALADNCLNQEMLRNSAREAKGQIQSEISRQLELLRSREVWLTDQVDAIHAAKEGIFRNHEVQLNRALGGLTQQSQVEISSDDHLAPALQQCDAMDCKLSSDVSPVIDFNGDDGRLRDAIVRFGCVDTPRVDMSNVFVEPSSESKSLPRAFEDYEDAEHHVLYKSVQAVAFEKEGNCKIQVKIPKLNVNWLLQPTIQSEPQRGIDKNTQKPGPTKGDYGHWLNRSSKTNYDWLFQPTGSNRMPRNDSIQQWLYDIKTETSMEDEEYEACASFDAHSETMQPRPDKGNASDIEAYFDRVRTSPWQKWVNKQKTRNSSVSKEYAITEQFRKIKDSPRTKWLLIQKQKEVVPEECDASYSGKHFDIENLAKLCRIDSMTNDKWLARATKSPSNARDSWLYVQPKVAAVCKANEPCIQFSDCMCEEKCLGFIEGLHEKPSLPAIRNPSSEFPYFDSVKCSEMSRWLIVQTNVDISAFSQPESVFQMPKANNGVDDWLLTPSLVDVVNIQRTDREFWLAKSLSEFDVDKDVDSSKDLGGVWLLQPTNYDKDNAPISNENCKNYGESSETCGVAPGVASVFEKWHEFQASQNWLRCYDQEHDGSERRDGAFSIFENWNASAERLNWLALPGSGLVCENAPDCDVFSVWRAFEKQCDWLSRPCLDERDLEKGDSSPEINLYRTTLPFSNWLST